VRLKLTPVVEGSNEANFRVQQLGTVGSELGTGRLRIALTDYKHALIYHCLQQLSDGACLPGQMIIELLSRRPSIADPRFQFAI
jgi:hypothetical protein